MSLLEKSKKTLEYLRLKEREELKICSGKLPIPRQFLEKVFKKKIPKEKKEYYRKKFLRNCKELLNLLYDKEYIQDVYDNIYKYIPQEVFIYNKKSLEILINILLFIGSFGLSWSDYLVFYPSGQKIIENVLYNPKDWNALNNLYIILENVYLKRGYDNAFFRKEFFKILPDLDHLTKSTLLENKYILWITNKISTETFLELLQRYLNKTDKSV